MTKQPLFSAMTTDFDTDIKNFKEILNELEIRYTYKERLQVQS